MLLLAILQKPAKLEYEEANKKETIQDSLHRILIGTSIPWQHQRFALHEVASQITNTPDITYFPHIQNSKIPDLTNPLFDPVGIF